MEAVLADDEEFGDQLGVRHRSAKITSDWGAKVQRIDISVWMGSDISPWSSSCRFEYIMPYSLAHLDPSISVAVLSMVARSKGTRMSIESQSIKIDWDSQIAIPSSADLTLAT